ncbi:hypothetical protein Shal_2187 [Shewanella halifaxensis HAW-EB4]|uniref:Uncharacterized protein n=1 Tax=Shewanella halifaxensis (strain HAW-EB4) TaxID=458817 RepID=B0TUL8_SHEHH|nr:hypothetical protein [Shewanella halifaxensis]ABZ76746.1 hypothetical protein Shal_2187 [Shewanella halifaxensis HAW-EB4]
MNIKYWFHGSLQKIDTFEPFSHFGSLESAKERVQKKKIEEDKSSSPSFIHKCSITIDENEILFLTEDWLSNRAQSLARALKENFPSDLKFVEIWKELRDLPSSGMDNRERTIKVNEIGYPKLLDELRMRNLKAVSYKNEVEDKGHISIVIITPDIIHIQEVIEHT